MSYIYKEIRLVDNQKVDNQKYYFKAMLPQPILQLIFSFLIAYTFDGADVT